LSITNAQKKKAAKKKARERRIRKMTNMRNSQPYTFRLDIEVDGQWIPGVMKFRTWKKVLEHRETTERRRAAGEEIAPGKVVNLINDKVLMEISGSKSKGSAPDKITNGPVADPNVTAAERKADEAMARLEAMTEPDVKTGEPDK
jgi:hypothetical protein